MFISSSVKFINDPFVTMGYPWAMGGIIENSSVIIGIKYYLQNVNMDNTENIGLKLLPASLNNPSEKAYFLFNSDSNKPRLEIGYVIS